MSQVLSSPLATINGTFWCIYCQLSIDFTHSFGVSTGDIEQLNTGSVDELQNGIYFGLAH